jgi:hypothetical protein
MDTDHLQLTPEMRLAIAANPDQPVYITDEATRETYVLVKQEKFASLDEQYIRDRLNEGFAAIERGDVEDWDAPSIKADGRRILNQRPPQQ